MTKRDFFRVLIKIFGLYSAVTAAFSIFPTYIGAILYDFNLLAIIAFIGTVTVTTLILVSIINGADKIIDWLKLDKNFTEDRIEIGNLKEINLLRLAIIIISGLFIINNLPSFLKQSYFALKELLTSKKGTDGLLESFMYDKVDYSEYIYSVISLILGFLLITNYTAIARWLLQADKKNNREHL